MEKVRRRKPELAATPAPPHLGLSFPKKKSKNQKPKKEKEKKKKQRSRHLRLRFRFRQCLDGLRFTAHVKIETEVQVPSMP
jgi:hypothetical protein